MADLVLSMQRNGTDWAPTRVVDLGAGRMAWARHHGFKFDSDVQKIVAIDKDPTIDADKLFTSPEFYGVEYQRTDILPWLATAEEESADLVMLGGVASYFPLMAFTEAVIKPVYKTLKPSGEFFFDLQIDCPQYEWTIKLFGWPEMKLAKSADEAICQVENVRRALWDFGIKFNAEYHVDTACANPSAVMIVFQKL
jgi:SAM-dependent methyltransferase